MSFLCRTSATDAVDPEEGSGRFTFQLSACCGSFLAAKPGLWSFDRSDIAEGKMAKIKEIVRFTVTAPPKRQVLWQPHSLASEIKALHHQVRRVLHCKLSQNRGLLCPCVPRSQHFRNRLPSGWTLRHKPPQRPLPTLYRFKGEPDLKLTNVVLWG